MDLFNNIALKRALSPVSVSDNTAQVCQVVDHLGFGACTYAIAIGSVADADVTFTVLLEESDASGSGFAPVADDDMLGTELLAGFQFDDDNEPRKLGYRGIKRYTRMTITPANNASAALLSVLAIMGNPALAPTDNPPA